MSETSQQQTHEPVWVHGHSHEPNPVSPEGDGDMVVQLPDGSTRQLTVELLQAMPYYEVQRCYIVSTGHGTSGPFTFGGVKLTDLLSTLMPAADSWRQVDVISADGFGTRLTPADLDLASGEWPPLLAYRIDGEPLTRRAGLVRLIVPAENDDALKQVKWIARIELE